MSKTMEKKQFQAQTKELLDLMIHSVYSTKDVFLRELISNASDALDKVRLYSLTNEIQDLGELRIDLEFDQEAKTLTVRDNGIGMDLAEVEDLIGTIARSGTKAFKESQEEGVDAQALIGQFGIGFYSAFMAADKVTMKTQKIGADQLVVWESSGDGTYSIGTEDKGERGTAITLHLKEVDEENGIKDYTEGHVLESLVKKYSDFITYPIYMDKENVDYSSVNEENPEPKTTIENTVLNSQKALWERSEEEVAKEEYHQLYSHISRDFQEPWQTITMKAEGLSSYSSLLFVPKQAPMQIFSPEAERGLQLYVRHVFIMDRCETLMPNYLRFVRGVVDAKDLSLNVSREILQQDRQLLQIQKGLVRKILDRLKDQLEENRQEYEQFWSSLGVVLKEGLYDDAKQRKRLLDLVMVKTDKKRDTWSTLQEYVERMPEDQEDIYFLAGEELDQLKDSPHLESYKKAGYEVILLTDPVDEWWPWQVNEFDGKTLKAIDRSEPPVKAQEEKSEEEKEEQQKEWATFLTWMKTKLDTKVKEVRLSERLVDSPCVLTNEGGGMSIHMEQMLKAQGQAVPPAERVLELNPEHALIAKLHQSYEAKKDSPQMESSASLLYDLAWLSQGGSLKNPAQFVQQVAEMMGNEV